MVTKSQKTLEKIEKEIANIFSLDSDTSMEISTNRILEANNRKYSTFTVEFKQITNIDKTQKPDYDGANVYDYNNMTLYGHNMEALEALAKKNGFEQNSTSSGIQIVNQTEIIHRVKIFYCTLESMK